MKFLPLLALVSLAAAAPTTPERTTRNYNKVKQFFPDLEPGPLYVFKETWTNPKGGNLAAHTIAPNDPAVEEAARELGFTHSAVVVGSVVKGKDAEGNEALDFKGDLYTIQPVDVEAAPGPDRGPFWNAVGKVFKVAAPPSKKQPKVMQSHSWPYATYDENFIKLQYRGTTDEAKAGHLKQWGEEYAKANPKFDTKTNNWNTYTEALLKKLAPTE